MYIQTSNVNWVITDIFPTDSQAFATYNAKQLYPPLTVGSGTMKIYYIYYASNTNSISIRYDASAGVSQYPYVYVYGIS